MAYIINPNASIEIRTFNIKAIEILTIGSNPIQLSNKENWFPFFYGFECSVFTTLYDFTQGIEVQSAGGPAYFKSTQLFQNIQGAGFVTSGYVNSGVLLLNTAADLNTGTSFFLSTAGANDATVGDGDFIVKIAGLLF